MRISNFSTRTRRRMVATAACLGVAGAIAVPGVAWAQNAIPAGSPVSVATPAADVVPAVSTATDASTNPEAEKCGLSVTPLTEEELHTLRDGGTITRESEIVSETGESSTVSFSMATESTAATLTDAAPADGEVAVPDSIAATTVTAHAC